MYSPCAECFECTLYTVCFDTACVLCDLNTPCVLSVLIAACVLSGWGIPYVLSVFFVAACVLSVFECNLCAV